MLVFAILRFPKIENAVVHLAYQILEIQNQPQQRKRPASRIWQRHDYEPTNALPYVWRKSVFIDLDFEGFDSKNKGVSGGGEGVEVLFGRREALQQQKLWKLSETSVKLPVSGAQEGSHTYASSVTL